MFKQLFNTSFYTISCSIEIRITSADFALMKFDKMMIKLIKNYSKSKNHLKYAINNLDQLNEFLLGICFS